MSTHTTNNCYWPGGRKEGYFTPNFGQRTRVNITTSSTTTSTPSILSTTSVSSTTNTSTSNSEQTNHFVLLAQNLTTPGKSGVLIEDPSNYFHMAFISKGFQDFGKGKIPSILDSRVSNTMFISKEMFVEYNSIDSWVSDSAKATDGNFEIVGERNVVQHYTFIGNKHKITYTHALYVPMLKLNVNLISISAFDRAGHTATFGNGKGIVLKADGTVVLGGQDVNGMYILKSLDEQHHTPIALR